ncbi:hypothetical protein [Arsenophonus nasoniae]|uniref:Uncharacterized protein n=1 Tax=Arsenophonus nasoniae TaxID=638 RepID=A0A4P7L714_9GAMM|nr:hypothetical protein [Arsenophonus nasoniae]QBY44782.1 hypothetical protein ArsFIN_33680 [Arsenophonus nasoniae]
MNLKFAQQIESGSSQSERAVTRMSNQIRKSSGQAAVGFGNLHHVLTELVSGSNVAASTISNALVPAFERLFALRMARLSILNGRWRKKPRKVR